MVLSVRGKLLGAFGGLSLMVLLVSAVALHELGSANQRFTVYVEGIALRGSTVAAVRDAVDRRAIAARNLVLIDKPADLTLEKAAVEQAHSDVQTHLRDLQRMISSHGDVSDEAKRLVREIARVEGNYGPVALAIVDLALQGNRERAVEKMNDECRPLLAELVAVAQSYASLTDRRATEEVLASKSAFQIEQTTLGSLCLLTVALSIAGGLMISRNLIRALGAEPVALVEVARRISSGDLSQIAFESSSPEGSVMASMRKMQTSLASIVHQVRDTSDSIATGSAEIATGNTDLSQRTEEQASALQQTSATMSQLGQTVRANAESASHANRLAIDASDTAAKGGVAFSSVIDTMRGIDEGSKSIADIIGVIDGIAFQTNILALNAAVEAARAGEQGRGFAVVAGEVRTLAQRSATAAKDIKGLISKSVERVHHGTTLVRAAGETMDDIQKSIKQVGEAVSRISTASAEQSSGITQVEHAVAQMDHVTQQNAALVEESAAAAESLREQAGRLVESVSTFKITGAAKSSSNAFMLS